MANTLMHTQKLKKIDITGGQSASQKDGSGPIKTAALKPTSAGK
jgi:hypothetical protein